MVLIIKCHKLSLFIITLVIANIVLLGLMMMDYHNDNKAARALKNLESADSDWWDWISNISSSENGFNH